MEDVATTEARSAAQIFVIEDDEDIRDAITFVLSHEGYMVRGWSSAFDALRAMDEGEHPDLIVLDLMMPKMDGWRFRVEQRKRPFLADVPVLVASADGSSKAEAVSADAFMKKPIDFSQLRAVVSRLLTEADRRRLGAQLRETERLRALGTLVSGVAHEINNPLTFVSGSLELAERGLDALMNEVSSANPSSSQRVAKALADARMGTERIATIVRSLSRFSNASIDAPSLVDLHHVLDGASTLASAALRGRATLVKSYGDVPSIVGSEGRLGQAFLNLIVNAAQAISYGDEASGIVRITTGCTERGVFVEVSDNGEGIPDDLASRIFEPFFTTKPPGEGTGLGLSITHDIVRAHGGEISVRSTVGDGATFRVELPVRVVDTAPSIITFGGVATPREESAERQRPVHAPVRARVLVIDDEPMMCKLVAQALATHDVVTHTHAEDALAKIRSEGCDFDVVFCDLRMPGMDGTTFYEEVRRTHPDLAARFVFVTGTASTDDAHRFLKGTGRPVLEKPFPIAALNSYVEALLSTASDEIEATQRASGM